MHTSRSPRWSAALTTSRLFSLPVSLPVSRLFSLPVSLLVSLLFSLSLAPLALADPARAEVEEQLGGYEPRAIAADVVRLGEGTDRVLVAIARDRHTSDLRRVHALGALLYVPTDLARRTCVGVIRDQARFDGGAASLEVAACAGTLSAFGPEVRPSLAPLLAHPVAEVRAAAAWALGAGRIPDARSLLRARRSVEGDTAVRSAIESALGRLPGGR